MFFLSYLHCQIVTGMEDSNINFTLRDSLVNQKELAILESYDLKDIHKDALWSYYAYKANLHFYLSKDSVLYNLNMAFSLNERAVCRTLLGIEELVKRVISNGIEPPEFSTFLWDIPNDTEAYIRDRCKEYSVERARNSEKEKARKKSYIEKFIIANDQKYRGNNEMNWDLQNPLDLINRIYLDSLYNINKSFKDFNSYEQNAFSLVLHHSNDCEWNKKWILIWLDEISKGYVNGGNLFGEAIKRMLEPDKGVCWKLDPTGTRAFIDKLKKKFPKKLALDYGYNSF